MKYKCIKEMFLQKYDGDGFIFFYDLEQEEPPKLSIGCFLSSRDYGNNRICSTAECMGQRCAECSRYIRFYERADELQLAGLSFKEAVMQTKAEGYGEA